ncbi:MAG TPA: 50S ribosomal protein L4 [Candidatus Aphodocola excrementigallinarum]|uniref:Large ribosomal subunit protein uL4 n=1 Tax=Candidatus Aphodocola excrementigallinarum TaxID=2840670 RepID=A0A9D1LIX7_9FIRM|nr:50S ribosomal protein L4 [Candidatus Aphodocola excrementigallinarum]
MPKTALLSLKGEKIKDIKLDDKVWGIKPNDQVIYEHINLFMANKRQGTHSVKNRSEVSGGGRKPWRQKGTGNARQGSIRAPHFVGGGIVFGPSKNRNYTKKMNKKERRLALRSALTYKAKANDVIVVEKLEAKTNKTKDMLNLLEDLKVKGNVLMVTTELTDNLILSTRNIKNVKLVLANEVNTYDVLWADKLIITEDAIKYIEEVLK